MSAGAEPGWLRDGDEVMRFVAVARGSDAGTQAAELRRQVAAAVSVSERRLGEDATELRFDSSAAAAWSLLCQLRETSPRADLYLQPERELGKKLLICDMDMTIVAAETLDEVAARLGLGERIAEITARAMHGEIDFNEALRERIGMLAGQPEAVFRQVASEIELNPGARELIAAANLAGVHTILISGGFEQVAEPVARDLGFDEVFCNRLEIEAGRLTGGVPDPIVNADIKRATLERRARELGLELRDCCAIGDGANDLPMLQAAGLGIAYHAKPVLRAATSCHIDASDLMSAAYFMGLEQR